MPFYFVWKRFDSNNGRRRLNSSSSRDRNRRNSRHYGQRRFRFGGCLCFNWWGTSAVPLLYSTPLFWASLSMISIAVTYPSKLNNEEEEEDDDDDGIYKLLELSWIITSSDGRYVKRNLTNWWWTVRMFVLIYGSFLSVVCQLCLLSIMQYEGNGDWWIG